MIIKSIISGLRNFVQRLKVTTKRNKRLEERRRKYPTCHFLDSCEFTHCKLDHNIVFHKNVRVSYSVIGKHTYIAPNSRVSHASIGKYCSIGENVIIGLYRHPSRDTISTYPAFYSTGNAGCRESFVEKDKFDEYPLQTIIGNDVWICNNSILIGGVRVGDGAIVAAGSVVTKDVPPYGIVGGNPAHLIRYRFCNEDISFLLATSWWNWSDEIVRKYADFFDSINHFRKVAEKVTDE